MIGTASTIDRRKLFEQVAEHLQAQILDGTLQPGERLPPERALQDRFGVGRPAIREALILLQRQGLVELVNGARARVATPTARFIVASLRPAVSQLLSTRKGQQDFQQLRLFIETGIARQAAVDAGPDDLAALSAALAANERAIGDRLRFIETDIAFHAALAAIARNPVLSTITEAMSTWLHQQRAVSLRHPGQEAIGAAAHRLIHDAVAGRDPDAAEAAMRAHLTQLAGTYWAAQPAAEA